MKGIAISTALGLAVPLFSQESAQEAPPSDRRQLVTAVDECLAANRRTEFDSLASLAQRVSASCIGITGTIRLKGRGDPALGDILRYDAEGQRIVWHSPLDMGNRFGGAYSPYDYNPVLPDKSIPPDARRALKEVWDRNYWLIPIVETERRDTTYPATNGFGVRVEVSRREATKYGLAARVAPRLTAITALIVPMPPDRARNLIDHLDVILSYRVSPACDFCLRANTKVTGRSASINSPHEERTENRYLFADIARIQVVDRRNGEVIQDAVPNPPAG